MERREEQIRELEKETGFDEIVIGCFLSNYKLKHVCPIATGNWCRDYEKCKCMEEGMMRKIKVQQAHNQEAGEEEKTPVKIILPIALLIFLILCNITVIIELVKLIIFGVRENRCMEVVILFVLYIIIALLAAGMFYYITQGRNRR